jgi:hypothetical protein
MEIWTSGVRRVTFAAPSTAAEEWDLYTRGPRFMLKGQCYEMVAEIRPWSGRLSLN